MHYNIFIDNIIIKVARNGRTVCTAITLGAEVNHCPMLLIGWVTMKLYKAALVMTNELTHTLPTCLTPYISIILQTKIPT